MISNTQFAMTTLPTLLLVVSIIAVFFIGAVIGNFTSGVEAKKKLEEAHARTETLIQQAKDDAERAAARIAQAERIISSRPANPPPGNTLLRLWLDSAERPALDLDGRSVDTTPIAEVHRKRLVNLLSVMRPWLEGKSITATDGMSSLATVSAQPITPAPVSAARPAPTAPKDEKPVAALTIVAQIDEILQARLATSRLADRSIRLMEALDGGVIVLVGSQKFAGVGEVTDPDVQNMIRAAISEWEKKYTPGL
jgi:hypothetical protein